MLYSFDQNMENPETAETSGSTGGSMDGSTPSSTRGSTPSVEPVQPVVIPDLPEKKKVKKTIWKYEELKLILNEKTGKRISHSYIVIRKPWNYSKTEVESAKTFFKTHFRGRTPWGVYQRWRAAKRAKHKKVILL